MKLLTSEIKKRLINFPLYSQESKKGEAVCSAKYFFPAGAWTWYILEGNIETDEYFGVVINDCGEGEYAYISINELQNLKVRGLGVERDICFSPCKLKDIHDPYLQKFLKKIES